VSRNSIGSELTERQEHILLADWIRAHESQVPELKLAFHVPNEGKHKVQYRVLQARLLVRPGVPDIIIPVPKKTYLGLIIELKRRKGAKASKAQEEWLKELSKIGYLCVLAKGHEEAISSIRYYFDIRG